MTYKSQHIVTIQKSTFCHTRPRFWHIMSRILTFCGINYHKFIFLFFYYDQLFFFFKFTRRSHCNKNINVRSVFLSFGCSRTVRLYCSFVTKELLLNNPKYVFWEEYIVSPLYYSHLHFVCQREH